MSKVETRDAKAYAAAILGLHPVGAAWPRDPSSAQVALAEAQAAEYARADARAAQLVEEADPRTTTELLPDWERMVGLPDPCVGELGPTLEARRAAVVARETATGGASIPYFVGLATALGYEIEITEERPFSAGLSACGDCLSGPEDIRFVWTITVIGIPRWHFRTGESAAGDRLLDWTEARELECLLRRYQPSHTVMRVGYSDPARLAVGEEAIVIGDWRVRFG